MSYVVHMLAKDLKAGDYVVSEPDGFRFEVGDVERVDGELRVYVDDSPHPIPFDPYERVSVSRP